METKATSKIESAVFAVQAAMQKIKLLESQKKQNVEIIKTFLEEHEADTLLNHAGDAIIGTYSERGGNPKFDVEKFKSDHPKIYEKYLIETEPYKVFLPK